MMIDSEIEVNHSNWTSICLFDKPNIHKINGGSDPARHPEDPLG